MTSFYRLFVLADTMLESREQLGDELWKGSSGEIIVVMIPCSEQNQCWSPLRTDFVENYC